MDRKKQPSPIYNPSPKVEKSERKTNQSLSLLNECEISTQVYDSHWSKERS